MGSPRKSKQDILQKLKIDALNPMQIAANEAINSSKDLVLLSPTGTGKTLAFLLPIVELLDPESVKIQVLILVPSRELAMQIETVFRDMGTGYKANSVFGGRSGNSDKINLQQTPAVLIGTPGRVSDHIMREVVDTEHIKTVVLDEFDKSLEIGFEKEMREIMFSLPEDKQTILTSATLGIDLPSFITLNQPATLDFTVAAGNELKIKTVIYDHREPKATLVKILKHIGAEPGIIFINFKDSIQEVSQFLHQKGIIHGCFHGGMEQLDRERALVKFRNGTHRIILATDLAARGLDIPEIKFIIHYQLPPREEEFIHRNGRTARMNKEGVAYVLGKADQYLPEFIEDNVAEKITEDELNSSQELPSPEWQTLYITGGRRDKISKGDIAGLFFKIGKLNKDELGVIELQTNYSFVSVKIDAVEDVLPKVNNQRLKKTKVRVSKV